MDPIIEEEIMKNHNQADAFISLFFAGLDAVCYIVILTLFGCDYGSFNSPKQKLSLLIVIDAVLRIINMYTDEYSKYFIKEIFFSLFSTTQFFLIISFFQQIFEKSSVSFDTDLHIGNKGFLTILFFALNFSFKGILVSYRLLSALQFICIIIGVYIMSKYLGNKIESYLANITKKNPSFNGENFINNMPFFISIYFGINYCIEIFNLFIEHKLYDSYIIMFRKIFKECGKYLVFLLLITIYHTFCRYVSEDEAEFTTAETKEQPTTKKGNVTIYKDEDEYDDV